MSMADYLKNKNMPKQQGRAGRIKLIIKISPV